MASKGASINDFGLLIAYVLPGFVALWGAAFFFPPLRGWVEGSPASAPSVGGFLFVTLASIAAGLTVSTVRWMAVDSLHHRTGIPPPPWDFSHLSESVAAFDVLIEIHYRYYQFYSNTLVALMVAFIARRFSISPWWLPLGWPDWGILVLGLIFFLASRDTLRKYYSRTGQLLRARQLKAARKAGQPKTSTTLPASGRENTSSPNRNFPEKEKQAAAGPDLDYPQEPVASVRA